MVVRVGQQLYGPIQFTYRKGCVARDALAYTTMALIQTMNDWKKTAVYCSDVSGAYDRVNLTTGRI